MGEPKGTVTRSSLLWAAATAGSGAVTSARFISMRLVLILFILRRTASTYMELRLCLVSLIGLNALDARPAYN